MNDWLIRNADIVNEGRRFQGDVRVRSGRIDAVASSLAPQPGERVFDAGGRLLLPGMIDDQVHFREPGLEHKGDFYTESRAAVAGGVTSFFEMPNSKPTTTDYAALADKYARAAQKSLANHALRIPLANSIAVAGTCPAILSRPAAQGHGVPRDACDSIVAAGVRHRFSEPSALSCEKSGRSR